VVPDVDDETLDVGGTIARGAAELRASMASQ